MNTMVLNPHSQQALLALALKYESATGNRLRWRRDIDAAATMVLEALASGVDELFQVAVEFLETLPVSGLQAFLRLQQMDVPAGYEARVQMYRGVAWRMLRPLEAEPAPAGEVHVSAQTYRGVAWEQQRTVTTADTGESKKSRRVYRGQEY